MKNQRSNRRKFLRNSSFGLLGAGLLGKRNIATLSLEKHDELPKIKEYRTLGRTGFKVSDISIGYPFSEAVLKAALNAGINFIDTSETYGRGRNEYLIGNVVRNLTGKDYLLQPRCHHS